MKTFFRSRGQRESEPPKQSVSELVKLLEQAKIEEAKVIAKKSVKRAILIGINYFGSNCELSGCINDVHNVFVWLTKDCGYEPQNIQIYTDDPRTDAAFRPTRSNIEKAIRWLQAGVVDGVPVQLFMHYSGHGSWTYDNNSDEKDNRDESICPVDYSSAGCIIDDDLHGLLVAPIAEKENVNLTCLFDCCHSGTALDLRYDFEIDVDSQTSSLRTFKMVQQKTLEKTKCQVLLWSGCLDTQTSADAYIARQAQGAMTWGFLSVIKKFKNDLSYKKLLSELQCQLRSAQYEQIPHLSCSKIVNLSDRVSF